MQTLETVEQNIFQWKMLIIVAFIASAAYVHFRGKVRHRFFRQLTDHSTLVAPYNALVYLFSRVPNKPYLNVQDFPELKTLTDNWQVIREEGLKLLDEGMVRTSTGRNDLAFNSFFRTGWKRFYLKWYDNPLPSAANLCPKTVELLSKVPNVHGAMFTLLPPGGWLNGHRDPFAGSLRYHLGLRTPNNDDCFINVDGTNYSWRDGEAVMFDETYIHHAKNNTDVNRLILFCDVERPLRGWLPTVINRFVINHFVKGTASQNVEGEKIGLINRLYSPIFIVRPYLKRFKRWNRKLYFTVKYAVYAAVLCAIFLK